jgi:hypothetical protein
MGKYKVTTKRTKDTKDSEIYYISISSLRALRDLRGEFSVSALLAALPRCALRGEPERPVHWIQLLGE